MMIQALRTIFFGLLLQRPEQMVLTPAIITVGVEKSSAKVQKSGSGLWQVP